jgi:hypothetical protein
MRWIPMSNMYFSDDLPFPYNGDTGHILITLELLRKLTLPLQDLALVCLAAWFARASVVRHLRGLP